MPELPEIETIRRDLESLLVGEIISSFEVLDKRFLSSRDTALWLPHLTGQSVRTLGRKGKYLWLTLENKYQLFFHLRMTGQLIVEAESPTSEKPRVRLGFKSGKVLTLYDQRRFAEGWLVAPEAIWREHNPLGPDALDELDLARFAAILRGRTTAVQPLLMDQRRVAGIGNIYAQEALFKAAIRPTRPSARISKAETVRLFAALQETLLAAISHRGSTSRNYRDARGESGTAQTLHAVYRKGGKPCLRCTTLLRATRVGGRGTVYCPRCQK
jgi:formamidopyrimidine-DNA glycosylase